MPIRAVVFDRDGVLTFFELSSLREKFAELGWSLDVVMERWEGWCKETRLPQNADDEREFIARFWSRFCEEKGADAAASKSILEYDYTAAIRAFADARPALLAARKLGLRVGVLSNFPLVRLEQSLASAGLVDLVDRALAAPVIGVSKPNPGAYRAIAEALGVEVSECAMVDDEVACVDGARAVGMKAFLLDRRPSARSSEEILGSLDAFIHRVETEVTSFKGER